MGRSRVTDEQLLAAASRCDNLRQLLEDVGLVGRGGNYALYRARLLRIGVTDPRFHRREARPDPTERELRAAADECRSVAAVAVRLGRRTTGRDHRRIGELLEAFDIDTRHFTGQAWNRGRRDLPAKGAPLDTLLRVGSSIRSSALKRRLLREGRLDAVCSQCALTQWLGQPVPLELDHVNGRSDDNRIDNLRLLCPNCHALTPTYRGRNIGRVPVVGSEPSPP